MMTMGNSRPLLRSDRHHADDIAAGGPRPRRVPGLAGIAKAVDEAQKQVEPLSPEVAGLAGVFVELEEVRAAADSRHEGPSRTRDCRFLREICQMTSARSGGGLAGAQRFRRA